MIIIYLARILSFIMISKRYMIIVAFIYANSSVPAMASIEPEVETKDLVLIQSLSDTHINYVAYNNNEATIASGPVYNTTKL